MGATIKVQSTTRSEVLNITQPVQDGVTPGDSGLLFIRIPHTTAAIFIGEDDEELRADILKVATQSLTALRPFRHIRNNNPNTEAHVFSSLFGTSITVRVHDGRLLLGQYQHILLLEMDGPKQRTVELDLFPAESTPR